MACQTAGGAGRTVTCSMWKTLALAAHARELQGTKDDR